MTRDSLFPKNDKHPPLMTLTSTILGFIMRFQNYFQHPRVGIFSCLWLKQTGEGQRMTQSSSLVPRSRTYKYRRVFRGKWTNPWRGPDPHQVMLMISECVHSLNTHLTNRQCEETINEFCSLFYFEVDVFKGESLSGTRECPRDKRKAFVNTIEYRRVGVRSQKM